MQKVLVVLADGFEETEAITPVDLLLRAGADVTLAGLDSLTVSSSHGISVCCKALLKDVYSQKWNAVVLPGGMPGASNLAASEFVKTAVLNAYSSNAVVAAICASPAVVLGPLGVLKGRKAVCYPGMERCCPEVKFSDEKAVRDGNVVTSRGVGCSLEFGLEIVSALYGDEKRKEIEKEIVFCGTGK